MHLEVMNESRLDGVIEKSNLAQTFWKIVVKHRKNHRQHNYLACIEKNIKPHSLRIGGHTYYTVGVS